MNSNLYYCLNFSPSVFDDAFYSNLAAEANSESDVSDANANDIAQSLAVSIS